MQQFPKTYAGRFVAGGLALTLFGIAYAPHLKAVDQTGIAERFHFVEHPLDPARDPGTRILREVHPDYAHMAGWISSVGASVALGDLDGDGLSNDVCLVDPRNDSVTLRPVTADAGQRYRAFELVAERAVDGPPIAPMGCILADVDADGAQDVVVYYWGRTPVIFRQDGALTAAGFKPFELAKGEVWYSNAGVFTDIDGDGFGDLAFGNYFPDESGVLDPSGSRPVEMQHSMSRAWNAGTNRLFLNSGAARGVLALGDASEAFTEQMANGWTLALAAADLTGDGLPELYVGNDFGPDRMLLNQSEPGKARFTVVEARRGLTDPRSSVLGHDSFKGMGVDFADLNGDGLFDIYVSNIAEEYALHESHFLFVQEPGGDWSRSAPFHNESGRLGLARSGWSWDAKLADLDNDGTLEALQATGFVAGAIDRWPELHELAMGNDELLKFTGVWPQLLKGDGLSGDRSDAFFVQDADGVFHDMASVVGLGTPKVTRGIALADIDGDGDLDFALARQWDGSAVYENAGTQSGQALDLDLRLTNANGTTRPAIGAVVRVRFPDGHVAVGLVDGSNGHSGSRAPQVHVGLGQTPPETLEIEATWRDRGGLRSQTYQLAPGRHSLVLDETRNAENADLTMPMTESKL
ncbi:FG-GAP repeat domain-containing protein [Tropicibacter sp. S64]|uniref:FG-GAP repeat domain-containing protein n=1 Tax=Tropicibacter sp. S64 TaxID=3415122 RepID=UPI003C7EC547